jgi:hypothetical protein
MILYPDLWPYFVSGFLFWSEEPWWLLWAQHSWSSTSVKWHHDSELVLKTVIVLSFFPVAKGLPGHPVDSAENESALCGSRNDRPYALAHRGWCHEGNPAVKPLLQQSLSKGESETVSSQTLNISTRWHIQIKITALLSLFNCTFDHSINLWMWPCVYRSEKPHIAFKCQVIMLPPLPKRYMSKPKLGPEARVLDFFSGYPVSISFNL